MTSWTQLNAQTDFLNNQAKFSRRDDIDSNYKVFLDGKSKLDIYNHIIHYELKVDNISSFGIPGKYTLRKNSYPYNFGSHLHYVFWINPLAGESTKACVFDKYKLNLLIDRLLSNSNTEYSRELEGRDRVIFRNAPQNKSVSTIEHFHVIFRND